MHALTQHGKPKVPVATVRIPSRKVEYAFYFALFYSLTSEVWGISVPLLAGGLVLGISGFCLWQLRSCAKTVYAPIGLLIACVISLVSVQVVVHGTSITDSNIRTFITWILQLVIVYSLCLRAGLPFRYSLVLFVIALATLPFLTFNPENFDHARVNTELGLQGGLAHPSGLGEWFGFFTIYFAILGLEAKRLTYRAAAWGAALGTLFVVALSVERGPLFATALAVTVASRGLLKRGFVPLLMLIILTGVTYESGLFNQAISRYTERGMEETGREKLWPNAIERIYASPLFGVGISRAGADIAGHLDGTLPHNSFLYIALSSGVVPLTFFIGFWVQAAWRSVHAKAREDDSFRLPYLLYTFVISMLGDWGYMSYWALLTLAISAGSPYSYAKHSLLLIRAGNKVRLGLLRERISQRKYAARYRF